MPKMEEQLLQNAGDSASTSANPDILVDAHINDEVFEEVQEELRMISDSKEGLRRSLQTLCEQMELSEILVSMFSAGYFTDRDVQKIEAVATRYDRNNIFVSVLSTKSQGAYFHFIKALCETGKAHLAMDVSDNSALAFKDRKTRVESILAQNTSTQSEGYKDLIVKGQMSKAWFFIKFLLLICIAGVIGASIAFFAKECPDPCPPIQSTLPTTSSPTTIPSVMTDCYDWFHFRHITQNGIYKITPIGREIFDVYCDMNTTGGGWTVIQRRINDSMVFWNKSWHDYFVGFNNSLEKSFWIGLDHILALTTKDPNVTLRIDIWEANCKQVVIDHESEGCWWGEWSFKIHDNFSLSISSTTAGNLGAYHDYFFFEHNGGDFVTVDHGRTNCTSFNEKKYGAWWYKQENDLCGYCHLNGAYHTEQMEDGFGFSWLHTNENFDDYWIKPVKSEMKIRRSVSF